MEGNFDMITNHAPQLWKASEDEFYQTATDPSSGKGLLPRQKPVAVEDLNDPRKSMAKYFSKIRKMRDEFNGNT